VLKWTGRTHRVIRVVALEITGWTAGLRPHRSRSMSLQPLWADEYVLSADEKTSIQARRRRHPTLPPAPHQATCVEHE
jgi:hypothetical protein